MSSARVPPLTAVAGLAADAGLDDERALACALIERREEAILPAWRLFRPFVDRTLRRLLGPDREREDLVQEVFLRFFRGVSGLRDPGAIRPFLFGIAVRVVKRELRRRWLARWTSRAAASAPEPDAGWASDPLAGEAVARLRAVLAEVGVEDRSLFVARYVEEMELVEVAAAHGLSYSTARRRLERAWERVRRRAARDPILGGYLDERGDKGGRAR